MKRNLGRALVLAALGMVAIGGRANADPTAYAIDSSQSYIQVGVYLGSPLGGGGLLTGPQSTTPYSSDTASLSGTLTADTSAPGGNISFGDGSSTSITPATYPSNLLPDANGGDSTGPDPAGTGGAPAQFGLAINVSAPGLGTIFGYASISNAVFSVADLNPGGTALSGGTFDALQQEVLLTSGTLSYWLNLNLPGLEVGIIYGSEVIAPPISSAPNGVDAEGNTAPNTTGTVVGSVITLPVFADVTQDVGGITLDVAFQGQIVTEAAVPEPSSLVLASIGLIGSVLAFNARRRLRKA